MQYNEIISEINMICGAIKALTITASNVSKSLQTMTTELSIAKAELEECQKLQKKLQKAKIVSLTGWIQNKKDTVKAQDRIQKFVSQMAELKATGKAVADSIKQHQLQQKELETQLAKFGTVLPFKKHDRP